MGRKAIVDSFGEVIVLDMMQIIKTRKSVRTFNDEKLSKEDIEDISSFANGIRNPYDIPMEFTILNSEEYGLSSPVIEARNTTL